MCSGNVGIVAAVMIVAGSVLPRVQEPAAPVARDTATRTHIEHVTTSWKDTPDSQGLLPVAEAEADVAATHAALAAKSPGDLDGMRRHAAHVLNALDPSLEAKGPGSGYGLKKAAAGTRQHIQLAAKFEGASKGVITHSKHVATAMTNVLEWTELAIATAQRIQAVTVTTEAAALVRELVARTGAINAGVDANKDGTIDWGAGEGGLAQARAHMDLLVKAEGL